MKPRRVLRRVVIAACAGALAGIAPAPATAASFNCDASALRGTVLTAPAFEPLTANRGATACKNAVAGLAGVTDPLPLPLSISAALAQTGVQGSDAVPGSQRAVAVGGIADARVKTLPELPLRIPIPPIPPELSTITIPVSGLVQPPGLPLPIPLPTEDITIDISAALAALVPDGRLPNADVVRLQVASASAVAGCVSGRVVLTSTSNVAGLSVLGQELPVDQAVDRTVTLVDTPDIDPSDIDVGSLPLPPGIAPQLLPQIQALIQPALDALPSIAIPATLVRVKTTPSEEVREGEKLTRRALRVEVDLLGQKLADLVVGEASVTGAAVPCVAPVTPPPPPPAQPVTGVAQAQLQCGRRRLALVDVLQRNGRVRLHGVADRALVGRRVAIRFTATGRTVATPTVLPDGTFSATAPLPPRAIRRTGRARYEAVLGSERSLRLKLVRRLLVTRLQSAGGKVTIAGRVTRPFGRPMQPIVVTRRVSCSKQEVVARIRPSRTGTFKVTVDAPPRTLAAVYRLATRVRGTERNPKLFDTFTLPRAVEIR